MTDDEIRDAWTEAGGDFIYGKSGSEIAEAWINELIAFARAIEELAAKRGAAREREACARSET